MALSLDIEETLENAYIAQLQANTYINANAIPVRRWRDASDTKVYPVIVVHCDSVSTDPAFSNIFLATPGLMTVSVMTLKRDDKTGSAINTLRSEVRRTLSSDCLVSDLNALEPGLFIYDGGIFWGQPAQDEDTSTIRRRDITQEVTATVVDVP